MKEAGNVASQGEIGAGLVQIGAYCGLREGRLGEVGSRLAAFHEDWDKIDGSLAEVVGWRGEITESLREIRA